MWYVYKYILTNLPTQDRVHIGSYPTMGEAAVALENTMRQDGFDRANSITYQLPSGRDGYAVAPRGTDLVGRDPQMAVVYAVQDTTDMEESL